MRLPACLGGLCKLTAEAAAATTAATDLLTTAGPTAAAAVVGALSHAKQRQTLELFVCSVHQNEEGQQE